MLANLKKEWHWFWSRPAGHRFQDFRERRQQQREKAGKSASSKLLFVGGILLAIVGVVLLPLPGPGSIVILPGLMMLSMQSQAAARTFDYLDRRRELTTRWLKRKMKKASPLARALIIGLPLTALATVATVVWMKVQG